MDALDKKVLEKKERFSPVFFVDCNICKIQTTSEQDTRRAVDDMVFGFLLGTLPRCPACGSEDVDIAIQTNNYCVDFTLTTFSR